MPWCPKCKSEYREGFSICADCGSELVDEEQFGRLEAVGRDALGTEGFAEESSSHSMPESAASEMETGGKEEKTFFETGNAAVERMIDSERESEYQIGRNALSEKHSAGFGSAPYRDNAERASDNRSSAWVLMVVGGMGIVVLALGITGVIPLHFSNSYLFYGVMAAVFILFLVAGIVSMKNALKFEKNAESENSVKTALLDWCRQNLRREELDRQIGMDRSVSMEEEGEEEILYFKRFEIIKARLNHQFLNLDQGFLEKLIDDTVYEMVYGTEEETI